MCVRRQIGRCLSGEERAGATRRLCASRRRRPRQRSPERRAELVGRGAAGCASPCGPAPACASHAPRRFLVPRVPSRTQGGAAQSGDKKKQKEKPPRLYFPSGQVRSIGFTGLSDNSEGTERCRPDTVGRSRQPDGGRKLPARSCFYCPTYQDHPDGPVGPTRGSAAIPEQLRAVVCSGKGGHEVFEDR